MYDIILLCVVITFILFDMSAFNSIIIKSSYKYWCLVTIGHGSVVDQTVYAIMYVQAMIFTHVSNFNIIMI